MLIDRLIITAVIGIAAGWLAAQILGRGSFGLWQNLVLGVLGSFIGAGLFHVVGLAATGLIGQVGMATVGAVALVWIMRQLKM